MRPWAYWMIDHGMKWVLYLAWFAFFPVYLGAAVWDAVGDWVEELKDLRRTKKW